MSLARLPSNPKSGLAGVNAPAVRGMAGSLLNNGPGRARAVISPGGLARRRWLVNWTKRLLPLLALALLTSVAMWPELDRAKEQGRIAFRRLAAEVEGTRLTDARYRGIDERGRPFTVTAAIAQQQGPERVDLTAPKGDVSMENGTWLYGESKNGVYMQHAGQLDLSHAVTLYRDDGTTLHTESASIDLHQAAAAGNEYVHAEGPFGTLDAASGFTLTDRGEVIQFAGPARLVMNGHTP